MKRPFDSIRETVFENLDKLKENQNLNFANSEKFLVWIVGFSIGGLSIIVTNLTSFHQIYSHTVIKITLILFVISIIAGIVFRWTFYLFQIQYQNIEFYLQGAFSGRKMMETNPVDLSNETNIQEVAWRMKMDFGEDVSNVLDIYNKADENGKNFLLQDLKNHHKNVGDWAKKDWELGEKFAKINLANAFGVSLQRVDKAFQFNDRKKFWFLSRASTVTFLLCCISFIAVIIMLTVLY